MGCGCERLLHNALFRNSLIFEYVAVGFRWANPPPSSPLTPHDTPSSSLVLVEAVAIAATIIPSGDNGDDPCAGRLASVMFAFHFIHHRQ